MPRTPFLNRLAIVLVCVFTSACAVQEKREAIAYDSIPTDEAPSTADIVHGKRTLRFLLEDYPDPADAEHQDQLNQILTHLTEASELDPEEWKVRLLHAPGIADARAVEGNYLFVWSGLFDVVDNEDELAGLLACEMAHLLAGHAEPVRFTFASELLFGLADAALTMGAAMASQGALNIAGGGITRSIFVDVNDLDPVERVYSHEQLREMAAIATLILEASRYSPDGLLEFWRRADDPESTPEQLDRLAREIPAAERLAILQAASLEGDITPADDATYADEPVLKDETEAATPDLGSNDAETANPPGTSG